MLFFSLLEREYSSAKVGKLSEFLLDRLQALLSLAVSDLGRYFVAALTARTAILGVLFQKVCDLVAETADLFAEDFNVIHRNRITYFFTDRLVDEK